MKVHELSHQARIYAATHGLELSFSQCRRIVLKVVRRMEHEARRREGCEVTPDWVKFISYSDPTGEAAVTLVMREVDSRLPAAP